MCLVRELLVVGGELDGESEQREGGEYVVGCLQPASCYGDDSCVVRWDGQEEEQNILDERDEREVDNLEEPTREFSAQDFPAVILFLAISFFRMQYK